MKEIYLAGGCFWGTEHFMGKVPGVVDTEVGYVNSRVERPTYRLVCSGATNAAEAVKVCYDPSRVGLEDLLRLFFMTIDPTSVNRQGGDCGTQYRTGVYWTNDEDRATVERCVKALQARYVLPLALETAPLRNFYPAEDYHQDYLEKNPAGYCHISHELIDYVATLSPAK